MSYDVKTKPLADEDLSKFPQPIQNTILRRFLDFAASPGTGGSRSAPSTYTPGQVFEFAFPVDGMSCIVSVVFRYSADEQTLIVERFYVEFE
jgi:hypothetical protein